MSGGGGRVFRGRSGKRIGELIRKQESALASMGFATELSGVLNDLLGEINNRDVDLVKDRLDRIKDWLQDAIEDRIDLQFGGSVAKRTYVDGLSDVDSLLIINDTNLELKTPQSALEHVTGILRKKVKQLAQVSHGQMAVTVEYPDGMKIQLLPTIRYEGGLKIPSSRVDAWSEIEPQGFRQALSNRNEECGYKLVATIKLAKAILGELPESQRLSGYHIESLAIGAFRRYSGDKTTSAMLPIFFERAKDLVLRPIVDKTGQSVHVDEYLGDANSDARRNASHILERIEKRMRNANTSGSIALWRDLFGLEE